MGPGSVEVRTKPACHNDQRSGHAEIRSSPVYAGWMIKPLRKLDFRAGACSLGQDSGDRLTDLPCGISRAERSFFLPRNPEGYPQKECWLSTSFGMRAQARRQQPTRPEAGSLTGR
ncbi:hypothetical protein BRADO3051 [Bradyrhizobium sp. ORS 278]|nr:hypothetical protein BRADO3051 [Bradyrhizobium sp. ORS 278]